MDVPMHVFSSYSTNSAPYHIFVLHHTIICDGLQTVCKQSLEFYKTPLLHVNIMYGLPSVSILVACIVLGLSQSFCLSPLAVMTCNLGLKQM